MSYTTVELVRHYLQPAIPVRDRTIDHLVKLSGTAEITFYSGAIATNSVLVKSVQSSSLSKKIMVLETGSNFVTSLPIEHTSVVVASNSSLSTIFVANRDYIIQYDKGTIDIKNGGNLSVGDEITIWYQPYALYVEGQDYRINYADGSVARIATGAIANEESVLIDFTPLFTVYTDDLLNNAVVLANGLIEKWVDPHNIFGADSLLQMSATCQAVAIICRTSAVRELSSRGNDRTAEAWIKLADLYSTKTEDYLKSFRPAVENPSTPKIT